MRDPDGLPASVGSSKCIHDIPYEITSEIFLHCLPGAEFVAPNLMMAPLILCQISRRLRAVALSTPSLWCSLLVDLAFLRGTGDHDDPGNVELFRVWLSRACTLPLTVKLYDSRNISYQSSVDFTAAHSMIQLLLGHAKQWRNITLGLNSAHLLTILSGAEELPVLRKLAIGPPRYSRRAPLVGFSPPQHLILAPKLCQVHFLRCYLPPALLPLPWRQLTTFSAEGYGIPECLQVLRDAPNLLCCTFTLSEDQFIETATLLPPSSAACLRSLTLNYRSGATDPMTVLGFLTLPSLHHLSVNYQEEENTSAGPGMDIAPFLSLAARSSFHHLQKLSLRLWPASEETIIQCLHAVPAVVKLKLEMPPGIGPTDALFQRLTGAADFLPRLEHLYVRELGYAFIETGERTPAVFLDMLEARWAPLGGMAQLQSLHFEHWWGSEADDAFDTEVRGDPRWDKLRGEGMELFVYIADEDEA
ncbi:hypothetical protein FB451DRAFT_1571133 [Mycena latifolia]|nr:hypothetical protein FB451DRAFT_1571133 [Mycena latifolia]